MKKKTVPITPAVIITIVVLSVILAIVLTGAAYIFFIKGADTIYDDMDRSITGALLRGTDEDAMRSIALKTYEVIAPMDDPKAVYEQNPDAYLEAFRPIQESEEYQKCWRELNYMREGTCATAVSFVIVMPEKNYVVYILDASTQNVFPCGTIYSMDTTGYSKDHANTEFIAYVSNSETYGSVLTDGIRCCTLDRPEINTYLVADIPVAEVLDSSKRFVKHTVPMAVAVTALLCFLISLLLKKEVLRPLKTITDTTRRFVEDYDRDRNSETNVFDSISGGHIQELQNLCSSLQSMESDINRYIRNTEEMTAVETKLATELKLAKEIQADFLPSIFPAFPDRDEFDIYASMDPAREIGGDFYDFFLADHDHLVMLIADVAGKGIPAALFMMTSKIILNNYAANTTTCSKILERVNNIIYENNKNDMFVTVWLGILDLRTGSLQCSSAGHEYPILKSGSGSFEIIHDPHGVALGVIPDRKYEDYELTLCTDDVLFVYTDGLPEATDPQFQRFGMQRIVDTLNRYPDADPEHLLKNMSSTVNDFVKDGEQFDDLTMLAIKAKDIPKRKQ